MKVATILDGLGGTTAVAAALDLPLTTVSSWRSRESIPSRYWHSLIKLARASRFDGVTLAALAEIPPAFARARRRRAA